VTKLFHKSPNICHTYTYKYLPVCNRSFFENNLRFGQEGCKNLSLI
jgi:hypothetical protein